MMIVVLVGSFVGDDTVVFTAHSPESQYWRVETKDFYTSKGWESSGIQIEPEFEVEPQQLGLYISSLIAPDVEGEEKTAYIYPNIERAYVLQAIRHKRLFDRTTECWALV